MLADHYLISITASVSEVSTIQGKNGGHYYKDRPIVLCQEEELVSTTTGSERQDEDSVEREVFQAAQSLLCTLSTKLEGTLCKEEVDGQLSLPL